MRHTQERRQPLNVNLLCNDETATPLLAWWFPHHGNCILGAGTQTVEVCSRRSQRASSGIHQPVRLFSSCIGADNHDGRGWSGPIWRGIPTIGIRRWDGRDSRTSRRTVRGRERVVAVVGEMIETSDSRRGLREWFVAIKNRCRCSVGHRSRGGFGLFVLGG